MEYRDHIKRPTLSRKTGRAYNENAFVWSDGNKVELQRLKLSEKGKKAYLFTLSLLGVYNDEQQVIIHCNGTEVIDMKINGAVELVVPITTDDQGIAEITISLPDAISPKEVGESNDARELALHNNVRYHSNFVGRQPGKSEKWQLKTFFDFLSKAVYTIFILYHNKRF